TADIVVLAKGIASGLPLGAIIGGGGVMSWPPGAHGSTFGGNPVSCAAALATLDLIEGGLQENAATRGVQLREGLGALASRHAARDAQVAKILAAFGMTPGTALSGVASGGRFAPEPRGAVLETFDPTTGVVLARVRTAAPDDYTAAAKAARAAFERWRLVPAPRRGEFVRLLGERFRERKEDLARLISVENGKILSEARGEVQEVIDMCDLAV